MKKVAFFDLFAGGGGASEGALQANAIVPMSVEMWEEAARVHEINHPNTKVIRKALGNFVDDVNLIIHSVRVYKVRGYHIHLHGSPPCQALSNASKTNSDEGMKLVNHFLKLVDHFKELKLIDSWSMENVVPVAKKLPSNIPYVKLNSADFGVAQTRVRVFAGEGWEAQPTHNKDQWLGVIDVEPHLNDELASHMDSGRGNAKTTGVNPKTGKKAGGSGYLYRELNEPSYTIMTSARNLVTVNTCGGGESMGRRVVSAERDISKPSKTIHNNTPSLRNINNTKATKLRTLTIVETAKIQGFPNHYNFSSPKTKKSKWTIIGNAVVPAVMKAIIEGIK